MSAPPRGPGRPRSPRTRQAVLDAAVQLAADGGPAALSMSAIASRAGVSRVTLYRWWASPGAIVLDGLLEHTRAGIEHRPGMPAREAIAEQMAALVDAFTDGSPAAAAIRAVTAGAGADPQLARDLQEHWHRPRRQVAADILRHGVATGEVRPGLDVEAAIDMLFAPIYHRLLIGHQPLGPELVDHLLDAFAGFTEIGRRGRLQVSRNRADPTGDVAASSS